MIATSLVGEAGRANWWLECSLTLYPYLILKIPMVKKGRTEYTEVGHLLGFSGVHL